MLHYNSVWRKTSLHVPYNINLSSIGPQHMSICVQYAHTMCARFWCALAVLCIHEKPISLLHRDSSQTLMQSYGCLSASAVTMKDMNNIDCYAPQQNWTKGQSSHTILEISGICGRTFRLFVCVSVCACIEKCGKNYQCMYSYFFVI